MLDYKGFYKKSVDERISFTHKFRKVYSYICEEINKVLDNSSNLLLLSAGHSSMVDMLKFKNIHVLEIIDDFHSLYKTKNSQKSKNVGRLAKNKKP